MVRSSDIRTRDFLFRCYDFTFFKVNDVKKWPTKQSKLNFSTFEIRTHSWSSVTFFKISTKLYFLNLSAEPSIHFTSFFPRNSVRKLKTEGFMFCLWNAHPASFVLFLTKHSDCEKTNQRNSSWNVRSLMSVHNFHRNRNIFSNVFRKCAECQL